MGRNRLFFKEADYLAFEDILAETLAVGAIEVGRTSREGLPLTVELLVRLDSSLHSE
jgi:hypothetical protein